MDAAPQSLREWFADNSLSIVLFALFLACVSAQGVFGWFAYNASVEPAGLPPVSLGGFLVTGHFLDGIFSNWQAAILQLAVLIVLSSVLRQRGAAHSRKPDAPNYRRIHWRLRSRDTWGQWLYANSLSLAFLSFFVVNFAAHLQFGEWSYNEDQRIRRLPETSLATYAVSPDFWSSVMECWEAEFGALTVYIVLSIFLRQDGSAESKPVEASDDQTGGANE